MVWVEFILLIIGIGAFIASFVIPASKETMSEAERALVDDEIKNQVSVHVEKAASDIRDSADETVQYAIDKTERSLERLTNEKIMAVNEYADTVLSDIHKNHEEVVFLYDMLNDKQVNVKNTAMEVEKMVKSVNATAKEAMQSVREAQAVRAELTAIDIRRNETQDEEKGLPSPAAGEPEDSYSDEDDFAKRPKEVTPQEEGASKEKTPAAAKRATAKKAVSGKGKSVTKKAASDAEEALSQTADGEEGNNNEAILALHKKGKSNIAIARELGLGVGEVKLVIDLFNL